MKNILLVYLSTLLCFNAFSQVEYVIGGTFYDLQTNHSVNNNIVVDNDGTVSTTWNFSPNSISGFPLRCAGYNYFDGINWFTPFGTPPSLPRIGFPNIVVTPSGKEMIIAHTSILDSSGQPTDSNKLIIMWSAIKGSGVWDTIFYPWGNIQDQTWSKACGGITNENVYVVSRGRKSNAMLGDPGPLLFAKSLDGGLTWTASSILADIGSTYYLGFGGDSYSIDATGNTVAITYGDAFTDIGLLKSTDAGQTWTKYIIQQHPQPMYDITADSLSDINLDGIADTISTNGSDSKVLIDNNGMCHVWFSAFRYLNDIVGDGSYTPFYATDALYYWNENMNQNNDYVAIASAQDFNGDGIINTSSYVITHCTTIGPWGNYGGGITQMPSAGIDSNGVIFLSYQTLVEYPVGDTAFYHMSHRHVFMMTLSPPYNPALWTVPYNLVPSVSQGGDGFNQEAVYATTARNVKDGYVYTLYQRDYAPGHALSVSGSCYLLENFGNSSDIIVSKLNVDDLINDNCIAGFQHASIGLTTYFVENSVNPNFPSTNYMWDFGDGGISFNRYPSHTFAAPGNYNVCLNIGGSTCWDSICQTIYVDTIPPVGCNAEFLFTELQPYSIAIVNTSYGAGATYQWDFGDGFTSNQQFPSHTYISTGSYNICLTVTDTLGCVSNFCDSLNVDTLGNIHSFTTGFTVTVLSLADLILSTNEIQEINVKAFPNPTRGFIEINVQDADVECSYILYSSIGKVLKSGSLFPGKNKIDLSEYSAGMYFLKMTNLQGGRKVLKIVKE